MINFGGGTGIAGQYARISGEFNLRVWRRIHPNSDNNSVEIMHETIIEPHLPTVDIIYLNGWHFERLELQPQLDPGLQQSPAPSMPGSSSPFP